MSMSAGSGDEGIRVEVEILGDVYAIRSHHAHAEDVRRVAQRVDIRLRDLQRRFPSLSTVRLTMLAALNFADELTRLQAQQKELIGSLQGRIRELEQQVDRQ